MTATGIQRWGSYLPRLRLQRETIVQSTGWMNPALKAQARGSRTVANWDEDALTMAVAAGQSSLTLSSQPEIERVVFASTTAPFLDRSNSGLMAEAMALSTDIQTQDVGGSQRAATSALLQALRSESTNTLLCAADRRQTLMGGVSELRYGDAGSAVIAGPGDGVARFLGGHSVQQDLVDHYRSDQQQTDYHLEDRWVRDMGVLSVIPEAVNQACQSAGVSVEAIDQLIVPLATGHARKLAGALGMDDKVLADNLHSDIGETGVGHGLLMLAAALETAQPGQLLCLVGVGQGCDVLLFETTQALGTLQRTEFADARENGTPLDDYLKLPAFNRQLPLDGGIRAEADKRTAMSAYFRRRGDINTMMGSVCQACDTPHFPSARVCVACQAVDQMSPYGFSQRLATVKTFTEDWLAATPAPPFCYGNVAFDGGGNAFLEISDVGAGDLTVGTRLRMQFRIKDFDGPRNFRRYFWKPTPLGSANHG